MPKCLNCGKNEAQAQPLVGYTYCQECLDKHRALPKLGEAIELTTSEIKEERKQYKEDILQSRRSGQLSKEFVTKYPQKAQEMVKEGTATREEIKNAKNVWTENDYYKRD